MRYLLPLLLCLALLAPGYAVEPETRTIKETKPGYTVEVAYPQFPDAPGLNDLAAQVAQDSLADFHRQREEFEAEGLRSAAPLSVDLGYKVEWDKDNLRVVFFQGYLYLGGAHGMPLLETLAYDLEADKRLSLGDLFREGSDYLKVLSDYSRRSLAGRELTDEDWIARGTEPTPENFSLFYPTSEGLKLLFAPYQVAPYAAGIPEVVVPYSALEGLLKPL